MEMKMKLPPLYNFGRIAAQIVTALGCITGLVTLFPALSMFRFSFMMGMSVVVMGSFYIVGSLTGLGLIYGFLAIVKAQIDTRNAMVLRTYFSDPPQQVQ